MHSDSQTFLPYQIARVAATPLLLAAPALGGGGDRRASLAWLALLLTLLDGIDCNTLTMSSRTFARCYTSHWYQAGDKLLDQAQYAAALHLAWAWPALGSGGVALLLAAWLWRSLGVATFLRSRAILWLAVCPDVFKELLVLWWILPGAGWSVVALLVAAKVAFEVLKGSQVRLERDGASRSRPPEVQ